MKSAGFAHGSVRIHASQPVDMRICLFSAGLLEAGHGMGGRGGGGGLKSLEPIKTIIP